MQAAFKYVKGKKTGKIHKTGEKFAKFTVSFTDLTGKNIGSLPSILTTQNIQLDGSPVLTIGGTGYPNSFIIKGDSENLNPAAIQFTIFGLGCYQAQNSTESTLFMRMKPFIETLFTKFAWLSFNEGTAVLIHINFDDEVITETEETEPDQIFFTCSSKATEAIGECYLKDGNSIKIVYNQKFIGSLCNASMNQLSLCNLNSIIIPKGMSEKYDVSMFETAFLDLAKNMFEQCPIPEDVKIWNFQAVTKTVTHIVLV